LISSKNLSDRFKIRFWGVRGSIPTPGAGTVKYGGNTSCVQITCGETELIFDGGSGLRILGNDWIKHPKVEANIFFSHFHWDHIQGFPFFQPAFLPANHFNVFGEKKLASTLEDILAWQMQTPNFPVSLGRMKSNLKFNDVTVGENIDISKDIQVKTIKLNHPGGSIAYRITYGDKVVIYSTDHEHSDSKIHRQFNEECGGCDILIYDATYTDEEYHGENGYSARKGYGHSTWQEAAKFAKAADIKKLVLFHHDPSHTDSAMAEIEGYCKKSFKNTVAANEGLEIRP
jgi:phosphoribosyl 1,2-cyclic phosphodiesterase